MKSRVSVRDFLPQKVTEEQQKVLEQAALLAPTSLNLQQQRFYFITNQDIINKMTEGVKRVSKQRCELDYLERLSRRNGKVFFGAPLVIVIAVNKSNNYIDVDAGIAAQNIALAAKEEGLDSVIMAAPDRIFIGSESKEFEELLGFDEGYRFAIALAVGKAAAEFTPHELKPENIVRL